MNDLKVFKTRNATIKQRAENTTAAEIPKAELFQIINKKVILLFQIVHKDSKMVEAGILCTEASAMTLQKDIRAGRDACIKLKEVYRCI